MGTAGCRVRRAGLWLLFLAYVGGAAPAVAAVVPQGFFQGNDLVPTASADVQLLQKSPAAVFIFAADERSIEATRSFNTWSNTGKHGGLAKYAVAVAERSVPLVVMEEVAEQREMSVPVFVTHAELLMGQSFRIVFIEDGRAVETMTEATPASLDLAATRVLGLPPEEPETTPTPVAIADNSADAPAPPAPEDNTLTRLGEAAGTTVSIQVLEPPSTMAVIPGAYENNRFGMSVQFPAGWSYEEATNGDGAVAIPPAGVQLDLRTWAVPSELAEGSASAFTYIDKSLEALSRKYKSPVTVEQRLTVEADGYAGADITYTYARPLNPGVPSTGGLRQLARMQVFVTGGYVKAISAEGSSGEFKALRPIIDPCFDTFTPALAGLD